MSRYRRTGRKRKGYATRYDRSQDKRIKLLERAVEKKNFPAAIAISSGFTAGTANITGLNQTIIPGTGETNRDGLEVVNLSFSYRCRVIQEQTANNQQTHSGLMRFMIVWDRKPTDAIMVATDILETSEVTSLYQIGKETAGRFQILVDSTYRIEPPRTQRTDAVFQYSSGPQTYWKGYLNLKGKKSSWLSSAGTQVSIEKGQLLIMLLTHGHETNTIGFQMDSRIFFKG